MHPTNNGGGEKHGIYHRQRIFQRRCGSCPGRQQWQRKSPGVTLLRIDKDTINNTINLIRIFGSIQKGVPFPASLSKSEW